MTRRLVAARRAPFAAATALAGMAGMAVLAGCSGDTDAGAGEANDDTVAECQAAEPTGTFDYTDARGTTVSLDTIPSTVVAQSSVAAALWDAGYQVDGAYGELNEVDGELDYQAGNLDLDQVEVVGRTFGEFDVDQYAAMQPDLLVDYTFDGTALWYVPAQQSKQILERADSVGINGNPKDIDEAIELFVDLAAKLGVDTECSEDLTADRDAYETAYDDLAATAADGDLDVLVASATADSFYVVDPTTLPELGSMTEAGVSLMSPKKTTGAIFEELGWEDVADYADADVILFDKRVTDEVRSKMESIDTWANHPAVRAGQVYDWYAAAPYSYAEYAERYADLAEELAGAEPLD
jgi:iron complex transport system substrate-binding protein